MSISGARARSGAMIASPSSPVTAPSIITSRRPRMTSGMSGIGGTCMIRSDVVTLSGAVFVHSAQAVSTFAEWLQSQISMPA